MFSSKNRLRKREDIYNVFKKGKSLAGNFIFLRFTKNDLNVSRFAVVISSKVSKKSVVRNKIKRQLREAIQKNILEIKQKCDFVIIVKPEIINQKFKDIEKEVNEIFSCKFNKIISKKHF